MPTDFSKAHFDTIGNGLLDAQADLNRLIGPNLFAASLASEIARQHASMSGAMWSAFGEVNRIGHQSLYTQIAAAANEANWVRDSFFTQIAAAAHEATRIQNHMLSASFAAALNEGTRQNFLNMTALSAVSRVTMDHTFMSAAAAIGIAMRPYQTMLESVGKIQQSLFAAVPLATIGLYDKLAKSYWDTTLDYVAQLGDLSTVNHMLGEIAAFNIGAMQAEMEAQLEQLTEEDEAEAEQLLQELAFADLPLSGQMAKLHELLIDVQGKSASARVKAVFWAMLIALIGCVVSTTYDYYLKPHVQKVFENITPKDRKKDVKKALIQWEPTMTLCDLRIVKRETGARMSYKSKSDLVACLHRCKIVRILRKRKKWALVEFEDEHEIKQAWMRHKYLERIV